MTDILELAKQAGFYADYFGIKVFPHQYHSVSNVDITISLEEFASLLREKFIAELGEPVNEVYEFERWITGNTLIRTNLGIDLNYADPLAEVAYRAWKARAKLYALPKDKDERK